MTRILAPRWPCALAFVGTALLGGPPGAPQGGIRDGAYCFYGTERRFAPDGRIPYGEAPCALRIEVGGDRSSWAEVATQPGPSPSGPVLRQMLALRRQGRSLTFATGGGPSGASGTVTFDDDALTSWHYDLTLKPAGTQKGAGAWTDAGLEIRVVLDGVPCPMVIQWLLKPVSPELYDLEVQEMHPRPGSE